MMTFVMLSTVVKKSKQLRIYLVISRKIKKTDSFKHDMTSTLILGLV